MARRPTPRTALLRTGQPADVLAPAMPEGKAGEVIKVWPWGDNNLEPQQILRVLYDSGTATTCVERLGLFIGGKGFASPATGEAMANPRQTFNQLLAEAAATAAVGLGVAYILRFTYGGELGELYVADVDCLRREKDGAGRFVLNLKLAEGKFPTGHNQVYLPYDPLASQQDISAEVIAAAASEGGYWGHLLFSFTGRPGRKRYPTPTWWAAKEAVEADAEAPRYELKQFRNGFFPDAMVSLVGKKYDDVPDENWKPTGDQTEADRPYKKSPDMTAVENTVKALKGSRTEASVWTNFVETKEELPDVKFFNQGPNSKGLTDATARLEGRVYRRFGVPPVLCGVSEAGLLGNNQQIVNSIQLFSLVVNPARELCVGPLRHLYPHFDFTVTPLDPVDYIDPAVAADMTPDERRATRGLPPLAEVEEAEAPAPKPTSKPRPKAT
ncbi:hypothetical protein [Hymenobacter cheonanensis]|uniref:hypothetical protein n=1 Tax=Hymenobacter sp. CA2-7 TaxID=3063993 RepID=UPI0027122EA4|nr:hypothetical protein [Hymenobacter sp. CA2-7]MDO7888201.1 hypothetical protein [Hymenobacter sp. CA2-7]